MGDYAGLPSLQQVQSITCGVRSPWPEAAARMTTIPETGICLRSRFQTKLQVRSGNSCVASPKLGPCKQRITHHLALRTTGPVLYYFSLLQKQSLCEVVGRNRKETGEP
jgi:hypothetical protein